MDVVYVVKSHKRVDRFREKTYSKVILQYGFRLDKVYVFVSTTEDMVLYREEYPGINVVLAPLGVAAVDNFITDYFPEGQKIIYMNDDVTQVAKIVDDKFMTVPFDEFNAQLTEMFSIMDANDITYAGFYPVMNTMFMGSSGVKYKTGLCLIMDPLSLVRNNRNVRITISDKSDFEKSIQHFSQKGALLRNNDLTFKAEYYGKHGGFQGRNADTEKATAEQMQAAYPGYIIGINFKNEGKTSLKLARLPATKAVDFMGLNRESTEDEPQMKLF